MPHCAQVLSPQGEGIANFPAWAKYPEGMSELIKTALAAVVMWNCRWNISPPAARPSWSPVTLRWGFVPCLTRTVAGWCQLAA